MEHTLRAFLKEYLKHKKHFIEPSNDFINYLLTYTRNKESSSTSRSITAQKLKDKSSMAYSLFLEIKDTTDLENKFIHFILKSSELRKFRRSKIDPSSGTSEISENKNCKSVKKLAFGFKDDYFNESVMFKIKRNVEIHQYEILYQIYQYGCIYSRLKNIVEIRTTAFHAFREILNEEMLEYEDAVCKQQNNVTVLDFYVVMWKFFNKLVIMNHLHDFFVEHPKQPFEIQRYFKYNSVVDRILKICYTKIKVMINEFINTGEFDDVFNEFFVTKLKSAEDIWSVYSLDYGFLPPRISKLNAEKILCIGKGVYLLKQDDPLCTNVQIDPDSNSFDTDLDRIVSEINAYINDKIIIRYQLLNYISFAKDIFLHYRSDFIDTLYCYLKNSNRSRDRFLHGKSISYALENAFKDTFGEINDFAKHIDICILENELAWDYITLFCKLDYPLNLIFTKEIIMKYVTVFKFLWRIKKLMNSFLQLKRKEFNSEGKLRIIYYINFLAKIYCFIFEDVINVYYEIDITQQTVFIDDIRNKLNKSLDAIIEGIFQLPGSGKEEIDTLLGSLEKLCISASKINVNTINDADVEIQLRNFFERNSKLIKKSSMRGIC